MIKNTCTCNECVTVTVNTKHVTLDGKPIVETAGMQPLTFDFDESRVSEKKKSTRGMTLLEAYPQIKEMWAEENEFGPEKFTPKANKKVGFTCPTCKQKFNTLISSVTKALDKGTFGCPVCKGIKVVPGFNDLKTLYPKAAEMWSDRNPFGPDTVTAKSNKKALFVCPDCKQESYKAINSLIRSFENGTFGCPVCRGLKVVSGVNDLKTLYPEATEMWSDRNSFGPDTVTAKSNKKVWLVCPACKQEFRAAVSDFTDSLSKGFTGCPYCSGKKVCPGINDLKTLYPKATEMWSDRNFFGPDTVTTKSHKKVWLICPTCKQEFSTVVSRYTTSLEAGTFGCPVCHGLEVRSGINDLKTLYPKAAEMWSVKNAFEPDTIAPKSGKTAWFVCSTCKQEFHAVISQLTTALDIGKSFCPVCNGYQVISGFNDLKTLCPKAAEMWSSKNSFGPDTVTAKSNKKAWFVCPDCKHEYNTMIISVVLSLKKGHTACCYCSGQKVLTGFNDLATAVPWIKEYIHPDNKLDIFNITRCSSKGKVVLSCPVCHDKWESTPNNLSCNHVHMCFKCFQQSIATSKPEQYFVRFFMAMANNNGISNPFDAVKSILHGRGIDFVDLMLKLGFEYNGFHFHENRISLDEWKFVKLREAGYVFIRVLEPGLPVLDEKYDIVLPKNFKRGREYTAKVMEETAVKLIHLLEEIYGRKASQEVWDCVDFEKYLVWYNENFKVIQDRAKANRKKTAKAAD